MVTVDSPYFAVTGYDCSDINNSTMTITCASTCTETIPPDPFMQPGWLKGFGKAAQRNFLKGTL